MRLTVFWKTRNPKTIRKIRERFGIAGYMTVNRETECDIKDEDLTLLEEVERKGFIRIRKKQQFKKSIS